MSETLNADSDHDQAASDDSDYFDELEETDGEEERDGIAREDDFNINGDGELYVGAPITLEISMLLVITFVMRHNLSGLALMDLLTLISVHCISPNRCASSMGMFKKFFMKLKNPIEQHHYCTFCYQYLGTSILTTEICTNKHFLQRIDGSSYFIVIPLVAQLQTLIPSE